MKVTRAMKKMAGYRSTCISSQKSMKEMFQERESRQTERERERERSRSREKDRDRDRERQRDIERVSLRFEDSVLAIFELGRAFLGKGRA
jgi:Ni/Co efflux regulator RcnB